MSEQQSNVKVKPPRPPVLSKKPAKPTKPPKPPSGNTVKGKPTDSEANQETDILKAPETAGNHLQGDHPDVGTLSNSPSPVPKGETKAQKKDTASADDVGTNADSNPSNDIELTASNNATSQVTETIQQENQGSLSRSVSSGSADSLKEKVGTPSSSPKVPVRRPKPPRVGHTEDQNCDTHQVNGERESASPSSSVSRNSSGRPPTRPKPPPKRVKKQESAVPSTDSETPLLGPNKLEKEAVNGISGKLSKDSPCGSDSESGSVKDDSSVEKKPPPTSKKPMRPPPPSKRPSQMDKVVPVTVTTEKSKPPPLSKPKFVNSAKVGNIVNSSPSVEKDANGTKALGSGEQRSVGSKTEGKFDQKLVPGHLTPVRDSGKESQPLPPPRKKRLSLIANESMDMQSQGPLSEDSGKSEEILKDQNEKGPSESVLEVKAEKEKPKRPGPPTSVSKRSSNGTMFAVFGKIENAETNGSVSETVKETVAEKCTEESKISSETVGEIKPRRKAPEKPPPPDLKALKQKSITRDASPIRKTLKNDVEEGTHSGKSSPQRSPSKRPTAPPPPVPPLKTKNGQSQETPTKTPPKRPAPPLSIKREKEPEKKVEESPAGESGETESAPGGEDEVSSPPPVNEVLEDSEVFRPESSTTESSTGEEGASEDRGDPHSLHSDDDFSSDEFSDDERGDEERQAQEDDADFISTLTKEKKKAYQVAKEIRDSEAVFVDVLKLLAQDFKEFINKATLAQGQPVIEDALLDQILGGLPHLLTFNEELLKDFQNRVKDWPQNPKMGDIFVKKGPYLKLYTTYIQNFEKHTADLDDACNKYPLFGAAVRDFEATARCQSLQVRHYMLKPVQRIPQYRLLLTDYQKNLQPGSEDEQETIAALAIVSEVASHVNNHFKAGDNFEKLLSIQHSLIGQHDIVKPGRTFIKEGVLNKISRKELQQRKLFLLSDVLITTASFPSGLRLKAILPLVGMKVTEPQQIKDHENEFNILSVERSFTLCASSPEEKEEWVQAIQKAVDAVIAKRSTFQNEEDALPTQEEFVLGSQAPLWIPDARVTMCQICTSEFTITWRRHHCRACGKVVCGNCSKNKAKLDYLGKIARICEDCVDKLGVVKEADPGVKRRKSHTTPNKPQKYQEVTANELDSTISGYLHYKEKRSWKKMWYVVKDKVLYTYKASEDVAALKTFPLIGFSVEAGENCEIKLTQNKVSLVFKADSPSSAKEWADAFEEATKL